MSLDDRDAHAATVLQVRNETRATVLGEAVEVGQGYVRKLFGLMGRRSLDVDAGLWLSGSNGIHMMFMRFPIDAVFLGRSDPAGGRAVVGIRRALRPWTGIVWYVRGADSVLELPAGTIAATSTTVGDVVRFETA